MQYHDKLRLRATCPPHLDLRHIAQDQLGVFARQKIRKGRKVFEFLGRYVHMTDATGYALQVSDDLFFEGADRFDEMLNHSCQPNVAILFASERIYARALHDILPTEEITFNYNTTEWDLLHQDRVFNTPCSFDCDCGAAACGGRITGFRHLSVHEQLHLGPLLSPFLKLKLIESAWQLSLTNTAEGQSLLNANSISRFYRSTLQHYCL